MTLALILAAAALATSTAVALLVARIVAIAEQRDHRHP